MSSSAMQLSALIINSMWALFTRWKLPGLGFTPAMLVCFLIVFRLVISFVSNLFSGTVSAIPSQYNYQKAQAEREARRGGKR